MSSGSGRSGARLQKFATVSKSASPRRSSQIALLLIAIAATAVVAPMFFLGNASGHDFSFHLASWLDVAGQWREGVFFPRWAQWANWGFGEPRFIFYPPASWTLGAALGSVLPWKMVPGTYTWLVLLLSGFAMWRLARESLPDSQAIAAAAHLRFESLSARRGVLPQRLCRASRQCAFSLAGLRRAESGSQQLTAEWLSAKRFAPELGSRAPPCVRLCRHMAFKRASRCNRDILRGVTACCRLLRAEKFFGC